MQQFAAVLLPLTPAGFYPDGIPRGNTWKTAENRTLKWGSSPPQQPYLRRSHQRPEVPSGSMIRSRGAPPTSLSGPGRLEAADSQTSAARVQDHRPHLDCGAQLRLAWPKSTIEQGLRVLRAEPLRHSSKSPEHALCSIASLRHEPF